MLFKSALLTQASGSVGGLTASRNRGGMYFRARAIPTDPATSFQLSVRGIFGSLVDRWNNTLTQGERDSWDVYASLVTLKGPLGDPITVSGQNHYVRANTARGVAGVTIIDLGPVQFDLGELGVVGLDTVLEAGSAFNITFDNTQDWATAPDGHLIVQVGRPQNPSISFFRGPWRFVGTVDGGVMPPTSPATFTNPFTQTAGQRVWVRVRGTDADGRLSQAVQVGPVVVV